jgi:hypothetical protein
MWDGCTILDLNKIEQIQHEAARIVTGVPTFASIESLYFETGCFTVFRFLTDFVCLYTYEF